MTRPVFLCFIQDAHGQSELIFSSIWRGKGESPIFCKGLLLTLLGAVRYITAFDNSVVLALLESFLFFSKICSTYYKITR